MSIERLSRRFLPDMDYKSKNGERSMISQEEEVRMSDDYGASRRPEVFDYPFYKLDMTLVKKAVEDLVLVERRKEILPDKKEK